MPEEAYEVRYDPDALTNLIAKPEKAAQVATLEKALEDWMVKTNDPLLEVFRKRDDAAFREQYMKQLEGKQTSTQDRKVANKALSAAKPADALIALEAPKNIVRGQKAVLKVKHTLSADLGEKPIQVTLKGGGNERIERKEVKASGAGEIEVAFDIPAEVPGNKVIFAGLVGTRLKDSVQPIQTKPVPVK